MKIRRVQFNDKIVSPNVLVEFDGRHPSQPLVEDLIIALLEQYSWMNLRSVFYSQQGGFRGGVGSGIPACYLVQREREDMRFYNIAKVVAEREDEQAQVYLFDSLRDREFLRGYASRLSSRIDKNVVSDS